MIQKFKKMFLAFTRRERIAFFISGGVALASFAVVISLLVAQETTVVPAAGGEYSEGMGGQPEYVNPVTAGTVTDLSLVKMVYSNMNDIADSVTESTDGRTWTVRLKDNLQWQDGQKLTSDDVIFTVQSIQNPDANSPLYQSWQGVAVNRVSELELQFNLANPYAFFADDLKNLYIIPKHLFASIPPGNWRLSDYDLKPVGSGPYEFVSYDKQSDGIISGYHLKAWNNYFGTKPLIQNFDFSFFANVSDLVKSFNNGQIDGMGGLAAADMQTIARPYDLFAWQVPSYYAVFFNQSKSIPLQDPAVRAALSEAVDRDALVNDTLGGHGQPEYGPIPKGAPYYAPTIPTSSLDLASATLTAAGWTVPANTTTGFRVKIVQKTSVPLVINLTVPQIDFLTKTATELQNDWQAIGIQVNIGTYAPNDIFTNAVQNRDYEALLFGNILGPSSDLYAFWDSSQRFSPGLNLAIYSNKAVDSLIESARTNLDNASRATQFQKIQNDILVDDPAVFLYSPDYLYVTDKDVRGVTTDLIPDPSDRFREIGTWYLDTARVLK